MTTPWSWSGVGWVDRRPAVTTGLTLVLGGLHTNLHAYRTFPDPGPLSVTSTSWPYLVAALVTLLFAW